MVGSSFRPYILANVLNRTAFSLENRYESRRFSTSSALHSTLFAVSGSLIRIFRRPRCQVGVTMRVLGIEKSSGIVKRPIHSYLPSRIGVRSVHPILISGCDPFHSILPLATGMILFFLKFLACSGSRIANSLPVWRKYIIDG